MHDPCGLADFVAESNRIEGIIRVPTNSEIKAHVDLLGVRRLTVGHVEKFVSVCQPDAKLRATPDVPGVRVGNHIAPPSGLQIETDLRQLLLQITMSELTPFEAHCRYETLHPFTDGNGRSGRALWLWHMHKRGELERALNLGFLHSFYYQTLAAHPSRRR
jgi:hypothetical protein